VVLAAGCGSPSVADDLTLGVEPGSGELQVDSVCKPVCGGADSASIHIAYSGTTRPATDTVDFKQYRVDYTLHGVNGTVPYFAGLLAIPLAPGADEMQTLQLVGSAQRKFVADATDGQPVSGSAKLELAGYDFDNRQVFISSEFNVRFEDLVSTSGNDSGTGNALDAGASDAQ
jgi:hypothetical protein